MERPREPTPKDGTPPRFVPIRPNPYIVGNPVRGRSMFFGREAEFELVRKRFQDGTHGGLLVFCGERRSGKTSILFQILDRRLGPTFIPVLVDMQSMAVPDEADFFGKIAAEILQALGAAAASIEPPDFTASSSTSAAFQKFVARVMGALPDHKLILLFDEYELFENKIESGVLSEDTLHVLANLMENQSIFMVFTGSQHLEARRHDYWKILGKSIYKRISYLDRQDALDLIRKPVEGIVHYAAGTVEDIYRLTAGQPFYTQAVCQNLVDWLNENATRDAGRDAVAAVADGLVENPLPQMIFLWDTLARDEKLALALLAETLADEDSFATSKQLVRTIAQRDYPLDLDAARVAPALEKLFKEDELLLKTGDAVAGYAFRMDLWRRWIRRMHSVWQVMRQEGFEIRRRSRRRAGLFAAAAAVGLVALVVLLARRVEDHPPGVRAGPAAQGRAPLRVTVSRPDAILRLDGEQVGIGAWNGEVPVGSHLLQIGATGFADTTFIVQVERGTEFAPHVVLRPVAVAMGSLDVRTDPAGALVAVDGAPHGASPVVVPLAPGEHVVEATLAGRERAWQRIVVRADTTLRVALALALPAVEIVVTTEPGGARITVDRSALGASPATAMGLRPGAHAFRAELAGFTVKDTSVQVTPDLRRLHLQLEREPPGELEVRGDVAARLYVDGDPIGTTHLYNWKVPLTPGAHSIRVVPSAGEALDAVVRIGAGESITYEYTKSGIHRSAGPGGTPE